MRFHNRFPIGGFVVHLSKTWQAIFFSILISNFKLIGNGNRKSLKTGNQFSCRAPDDRSRFRGDIKKSKKPKIFNFEVFSSFKIFFFFFSFINLFDSFCCKKTLQSHCAKYKTKFNQKNVACQVILNGDGTNGNAHCPQLNYKWCFVKPWTKWNTWQVFCVKW